jgi:single-strand DNA-binding protein
MANSLNNCTFIGYLAADPEVRYSADGNAICNFRIGVSSEYKKQNGEQVKNTEWVRVSSFGKLAGICGDWLKKGSQVYVAGKFTTRKWVNKDGVDQYTTEIVLNDMQMLGGRAAEDAPAAVPIPRLDAYRSIKEGVVAPVDDDSVPF